MVPVGVFLETRDLGDHFGGWYGPVAPKLEAVEFFFENRVRGAKRVILVGGAVCGKTVENFDFAVNGQGMGKEWVGNRLGIELGCHS